MKRHTLWLCALLLACGSETPPAADAGRDVGRDSPSGTGGSGGTGGSAGTGGGTAGTGGSAGTGGAAGTGGSAGTGGTAGAGGSGGAGGGDARMEIGMEASPEAASDAPGGSVDTCFAGVRAGRGAWQDASKVSADGRYRMRLALETADRGGTSGSSAWEAFAFALSTPEASICITEAAMLASAYMGTHHNCMDALTVTTGGRRYVIKNPDSAISYVDQTKFRRTATLTVFEGTTMVAGPITLPTVSCNRSSSTDGKCRSGGPCPGET